MCVTPHSKRHLLKYLFAALIFLSVVGLDQYIMAAEITTPDGIKYTLPGESKDYGNPIKNSDGTYTIRSYVSTGSGANVKSYTLDPKTGQPTLIDVGTAQASGIGSTGSAKNTNNTIDTCNSWWDFTLMGCFVRLLYAILWLVSFILGFAGVIFNWVFDYTIVNMRQTTQSLGIITQAWVVVRDLANIFFIFILIYLAIVTILQLDEHGVRHSLSRLIVAAVLINFSLFFVKVIIDVPNILAVKIYAAATSQTHGGNINDKYKLGDAFLYMFNPQSTFKVNDTGGVSGTSASLVNQGKSGATQTVVNGNLAKNPLTTFAMGIILMAVATFVFLAVIIIFLKRFVILVFLMAFSPLAFLGMALPIHAAEGKAKQFWETLFREAFYAPIFMLCVWITIKTGLALNTPDAIKASGLDTSIINFGNILSYSVVIVMLVASLIIAEEMSVSGAGGAMTAFNGMKGAALGAVGGGAQWLNSRTIGRVASTLINKTDRGDKLRDMAAGKYGKNLFTRTVSTAFGRAVVGGADKLGSSFDEKVKKDQEWLQAAIDNRHGDHKFKSELYMQGAEDSMYSADRKILDNQWHHESMENKANMYLHWMEAADSKAGDKYIDEHGHEQKRTQEEIDAATSAIVRYIGDKNYVNKKGMRGDGHGRLEADEVNELPRVIAKGLTYHDGRFKREVESKNADGVSKFFENATEGQALSAIRSLGASGAKFKDTTMRLALIQGLKKFKGEALLASFAKDDALDENIKSAAADSGYDTKITWDLSEALEKAENRTGTMIGRFKTKLANLKNKEIDDALFDYANTNNLDALIEKYQTLRSGDEVTRNYMDSSNGQRSQIKSANVINELNDLIKERDNSGGGSAIGYGSGSKKYIRN